MVVIKVKRDTDAGLNYLKNACLYLENDEKSLFTGGCGIDPDKAYEHMLKVRKYFGKTSGNPLIHFIVSFDETVVTVDTAILLAERLTNFYCNQYQILWCVHFKQRGCSNFHVHFIINSVSFINGMMFHSSASEISRFANYAEIVLNRKVKWFFE